MLSVISYLRDKAREGISDGVVEEEFGICCIERAKIVLIFSNLVFWHSVIISNFKSLLYC